MTPGQLIEWLDENVERHGAVKLVPPSSDAAMRLRAHVEAQIHGQERARFLRRAEQAIRKRAEARIRAIIPRLPRDADLANDIRQQVMGARRRHWTEVVVRMARDLVNGRDEVP
jgi:hypothetical protein